MKATFLIFYTLVLSLLSCADKGSKQNSGKSNHSELKKPLLKANRGMVNKERAEIDAYVLRRNWTMQNTGSGLRYMIYEQGNGKQAQAGKYAHINYTITLLDGTE